MTAYICGVVGIASVGAVLLSLLPQDDRRSVGIICRLLLLSVLVLPLSGLPDFVDKIGELYAVINESAAKEETGGIPRGVLDALERQSRAEIADAIGEDICNRFDLSREDVEVRPQLEISEEDGDVRLLSVRLIFTGRAMWQDPHPVIEYVRQAFGVDCEIAEG